MSRNESGFSLIELLVVVLVIGVIAAIAVPNLMRSLHRSKVNATFQTLASIKTALGTYQIDHNHYPESDSSTPLSVSLLTEKYYQGPMKDNWGEQFYYQTDTAGANYVIFSKGTDKTADGDSGADFESSWTFRSTTCHKFSYESLPNIVENGCDLVIVNGQYAATTS